jgi:ActR/RegA family two-component response regulator
MIVDDDFFILSGLRKMLERDYQVKTASDEETALRIAQRFQPDVVFIDLLLGYESGLDVAEKMREILPDAALILMSGGHPGRISEEFDAFGCDGFLAKEELALIWGLLQRIEAAA